MPRPATPDRPRFAGMLNSFASGRLTGWVLDTMSPNPAFLHVLVDQQEVLRVPCADPRPDVQTQFGLAHDALGFDFLLPEALLDGRPHELSLRLPDRTALSLTDPNDPKLAPSERITFAMRQKAEFRSNADGLHQGAARGWIVRRNRPTDPWSGACTVALLVDGAQVAIARADRYRGDVAGVLKADPNCGFEIPIPQHLRGSAPRSFEVIILPEREPLENSPFVTSVADDALSARLVDTLAKIDDLYRDLAKMRMELRNLIPERPHSLGDYHRWASAYYPALTRRITALTPLNETPLVTILCPTWRPLESDFRAALDSVVNQTYQNWELLIIDDAGKDAGTTAIITEYTKRDPRIRAIKLKANRGISGATNAGMEQAKGQYVAFFDHDDLLVDVAIETMVRAALESGAKLLYSDEDKIDQAGYFLEPNLKPDFNYRYLLGCNYICHLTMIEAGAMRAIGPLSSTYDGAQDHDFMLRATEIIPRHQILHVPEVLYHWRKTPNSTAVSVHNKSYARESGIRCVHDHLERINTPATVTSINGLTIYGVDWTITETPKVTIIIPFRDRLETTKTCVDALLELTDYPAFDILLVDNWSLELETTTWLESLADNPKIRILRVEEPFNYARLNNLAAQETQSPFLLLLNNDVFVSDPRWLTLMVNEALAGKNVGAVGAKLLYPNDTIQHIGVVVGPTHGPGRAGGGIGAHSALGHPKEDYGYIGRAKLAHETTAATAACLLVCRDVFLAVGGFDETHLAVAFNDVDLCLKIRKAGYQIIMAVDSVSHHHESLTRGSDDRPEHEARFFRETRTMLDRWTGDPLFERDPAYSRFFTIDLKPFFDLVDPEQVTTQHWSPTTDSHA